MFPGKPPYGPPPFGPSQSQAPPFRGPYCTPTPGHLPPASSGPFPAPARDRHFLHNRPPIGNFIRIYWSSLPAQESPALALVAVEHVPALPPCSSYPTDCSNVSALGGRQQTGRPTESPHNQVPKWNPAQARHLLQDSDRAGEEFLRCIAANKPFPDYLKGNMAYNLADAFKSANALKEAVKSNPDFQKHVARSRSRSRSRSRGRSRGKSRAKSRARSKSRPRSRSRGKSRGKSRGRSRGRSKSHVRGKSRMRSRSRSRSLVRSKSQVRRSRSQSDSREKSRERDTKRLQGNSDGCHTSVGNGDNLTGNSLFQGLKLVMNSKELEERLPALKDAILTLQASTDVKTQCLPDKHSRQQQDSQENVAALDNDSMLLPHDRVVSDFSWLHAPHQEDSTVKTARELEDEEFFLYGNEDAGLQTNKSSSANCSQIGGQGTQHEMNSLAPRTHQEDKPIFSSFEDLLLKQPFQMSSLGLASGLDSSDSEKLKNILKSVSSADTSEIERNAQGPKEETHSYPPGCDSKSVGLALPALSDPNVRQALESLQSLIKATKEKHAKREGSCTSQISTEKQKVCGTEERRDRRAIVNKMESLLKEVEGSMKEDGLSFLTPVIGFYCQKCEEFIGDLNTAESHAASHFSNHKITVQVDKQAGDSFAHSSHFSKSSNTHPQLSDKRDDRDHGHHKGSADNRVHKDVQQDWKNRQDTVFLKEEMKKERMLITVSQEPALLSKVKVNEEVKKKMLTVGSRVKAEDTDGGKECSKDRREKAEEEVKSGDRMKGASPKTKVHKKKKKKSKKKKEKSKS